MSHPVQVSPLSTAYSFDTEGAFMDSYGRFADPEDYGYDYGKDLPGGGVGAVRICDPEVNLVCADSDVLRFLNVQTNVLLYEGTPYARYAGKVIAVSRVVPLARYGVIFSPHAQKRPCFLLTKLLLRVTKVSFAAIYVLPWAI